MQHGYSPLFRNTDGVEMEGSVVSCHVENPGWLVFVIDWRDINDGRTSGQKDHIPYKKNRVLKYGATPDFT